MNCNAFGRGCMDSLAAHLTINSLSSPSRNAVHARTTWSCATWDCTDCTALRGLPCTGLHRIGLNYMTWHSIYRTVPTARHGTAWDCMGRHGMGLQHPMGLELNHMVLYRIACTPPTRRYATAGTALDHMGLHGMEQG
jgi:hypothetical protein